MSGSSDPRAEGWLLMRLEQLTARPHTAAQILEAIRAAGWRLVPARLGDDPEFDAVVNWRVGTALCRASEGGAAGSLLEEAYRAIVDEFDVRLQQRTAVVERLRKLPSAELDKVMAG